MMSRSLVPAALMLALAFTSGCRHGADSSSFSFSGSISSTDAVMGAVTEGDRAGVFVAGGPTSLDTMTRWFEGDAAELETGIEKDGWIVDATRNEAVLGKPLIGQLVSPANETYSFSLATATGGTIEGLYSTLDAGCITGVVVRATLPGQDPELQGVWCSSNGAIDAVAPVASPVALVDGAITISVDAPAGVRELQVRPYLP